MRTAKALTCLLILTTLAPPVAAQFGRDRSRNYDAERRQLENMRREVANLERDITKLDGEIENRQQQLADAPKTIDPAEKALAEAEKRQDKAKAVMPEVKKAVDEADSAMNIVLKLLKSGYDGAAQIDAAEAKVAEARARQTEARTAGVAKLKDDPGYKTARRRVEIAQTRMDFFQQQREDGKGSGSDVVTAASELLRFQNELEALEAKVLVADSRYGKAKEDMVEAEKTLTYLREQMVEKVKTDPKYVSAETALGEAREKYAAAAKELHDASTQRLESSSTLTRLKSQVKEFERDTARLKGRRQMLEAQLRVKQRRAEDYARSIRR